MDGPKKRLNTSIQFRLAWGLSVAIISMAFAAGAFSFYSAFEEAHELQDDMLRQAAALIQNQPAASVPLTDSSHSRAHDIDAESKLVVQFLVQSEAAAKSGLPIPPWTADGLHTLKLNDVSYRVLIRTAGDGQRIAVSQSTQVRDEIAKDSALRTVLPLLILVPLLLLVVTGLVREMLRPVTRLAAEIDQRGERDLQPLQAQTLPSEIRPFVTAINRLLSRVADAMEAQRRFVADAAHELRSPMTALSLQAERLQATPLSDEARNRLRTLQQGIDRGRNLLEQLLSLARVQGTEHELRQLIPVRDVYRRVLEELMPLAEAKGLDIGIADGPDIQILAYDIDLFTLVRNLVDNAIRYTPDGGRVDLSVREEGQQIILEVEDSGTGIPASERERVLAPFYRVLGTEQSGSGLGLSIVKAIAQKLDGTLELKRASQFSQGLKVRLILKSKKGPDAPG